MGYVTAGGYAHFVRKSMAMGYAPTGLAAPGNKFEVELPGEWMPASLAP